MAEHYRPTEKAYETGKPPIARRPPGALRWRRWGSFACVFIAATVQAYLPVVSSVYGRPREEAQHQTDANDQEQLDALLDKELHLAQSLIEAFPDSEEPLVLIGNIHSRHGHTDQALDYWSKALRKNPQRADVYVKMAHVALQTDEYEKAVSLWRQALERQPRARGVHQDIAEALMRAGDYEQSIQETRKEIEVSGESPQTNLLLGQAYQHLRNYERAKDRYEKVVAVQPDHMNACYSLYIVCARLKHTEEAKRYLAEFRRLKAQEKEAIRHAEAALMTDLEIFHDGLARFCLDVQGLRDRTGDAQATKDVLEAAFAMGQNSVVFLKRLALQYSATNRITGALTLYRRAAQLAPEDTECQLNIGVLAVRLRHFDVAEQAFRKVIALSPEEYRGYQELARLYLRTKKNLREARELARKAVALNPGADTHYDLGLAHLANGDVDGALAALEQAIALDPQNASYAEIYHLVKEKKASQ